MTEPTFPIETMRRVSKENSRFAAFLQGYTAGYNDGFNEKEFDNKHDFEDHVRSKFERL